MDNSSLHKIRSLPQKLGSSLHNVAVALNDQIKSSLGYGESTAEPPTMSVSPASQQKAIEGVADWLTRWKEWAVENRGRVIAYAIATGVAVVILRRVYERKYKRRSVAENESEVVVLTGADTSLGKSIALYLEQNGFVVFAAVPTTKDVEALGREGRTRLKGLVMDPTKPDSIAQAVKQVSTFLSIPLKQISSPTGSQERPHLTAVINAATATAYGPFETVPYDSWTKTLNVNVLGTALVTQSFLPLLRQNPYGTSRVVVLSSARDASLGVPFASPMSASRHAVEAMAESLRREIARFSIKVVCLQAGVRLDKEEDEEGEMGSLGVDEVWRREKTMQEYRVLASSPTFGLLSILPSGNVDLRPYPSLSPGCTGRGGVRCADPSKSAIADPGRNWVVGVPDRRERVGAPSVGGVGDGGDGRKWEEKREGEGGRRWV
ncbi:hypothetical protein BC936DRAFT_143071 [Jimgerdemannia flammicorona]|uniref:NAD(P)-binding protein n=1 Tax=Jimgerdemannia flammicorona TaxID=994334 RepID=A0A433DEB9_9FUNG|nr:hypothetical protein BC936DRAFT_143071 [Jimgerdemannia flammicorona]